MKRLSSSLALILTIILLMAALNACSASSSADPTRDPNQIATDAVLKFQIQSTQTAAAFETRQPKPTETANPTLDPLTIATATFGPIAPTITPKPIIVPEDKAALLDQNPPDNSQVGIGQKFDAHWTVKNTGKTAWTKTYQLRYFGGAALGESYVFKFNKEVLPGDQITLTADLLAPNYTGTFTTRWVLTNDQGQNFYDVFMTVKVITGNTPSPTPTQNLTPEDTVSG
jgi:hypothetical protein